MVDVDGGGIAGGATAEARELAAEIERRLADEAGVYAAARVEGGVAYLSGLVESAAQVEAAIDLAGSVEGIGRVENNLEVEEFESGMDRAALAADNSSLADTSYQMLEDEPRAPAEHLEPDFNEDIPLVGADMTTDTMVAVEEGIPYMPPTDPVVRPAKDDEYLEIVGGFGTTSMDEFPDASATTALGDAPPGDEDIRAQVLEALATDAATIDFDIEAEVRNGVVRLRGRVPTLDDAELVEEVAGRVPTVVEVIEELEVAALED